MIWSTVFYCSLPFIILLADLLATRFIKNERARKYILIGFYCTLLICIIGLRSTSVGIDTRAYRHHYETYTSGTFEEFRAYTDFEYGYALWMYYAAKIGLPFLVFNFIQTIPMIIPMVFLTFRLSKVPSLSLVAYICFGLFTFNMSTTRQSIAAGLCMLAVYFMVLLSKKKWGFQIFPIVLIGIAFFFHRATIMFLAFYPFLFWSFKKKISIFYLLMMVALVILVVPSFETIFAMYYMKNGLSYSFSPPIEYYFLGGTVILLLVFMIIYTIANTCKVDKFDLSFSRNRFFRGLDKVFKVSYFENDYHDRYAIALLLVFLFSYALDLSFHLFARVGMFGAMGFCILLPNLITKYSKTRRFNFVIYIAVTVLCIFYFWFTTLRVNYLELVPYGVLDL